MAAAAAAAVAEHVNWVHALQDAYFGPAGIHSTAFACLGVVVAFN
jgi:hypothetical protein